LGKKKEGKRKGREDKGKKTYLERDLPIVEVDYDDVAEVMDTLGLLLEHVGCGVFEI
jgi:hypothetical protein